MGKRVPAWAREAPVSKLAVQPAPKGPEGRYQLPMGMDARILLAISLVVITPGEGKCFLRVLVRCSDVAALYMHVNEWVKFRSGWYRPVITPSDERQVSDKPQ